MRISAFMAIATVTAVALAGASPATAQGRSDQRGGDRYQVVTHVRTVSDLASVCQPRWGGMPRLEAIAYCQGFINAAMQYHALTRPPGGRLQPLFCVPGRGPSIAESGIDFAQWAERNPRHSSEPALDGFLRWAQERFPCAPTSSRRSR